MSDCNQIQICSAATLVLLFKALRDLFYTLSSRYSQYPSVVLIWDVIWFQSSWQEMGRNQPVQQTQAETSTEDSAASLHLIDTVAFQTETLPV